MKVFEKWYEERMDNSKNLYNKNTVKLKIMKYKGFLLTYVKLRTNNQSTKT